MNRSQLLTRKVVLGITKAAVPQVDRLSNWLLTAHAAAIALIVSNALSVQQQIGRAALMWLYCSFLVHALVGALEKYLAHKVRGMINAAVVLDREIRDSENGVDIEFISYFRRFIFASSPLASKFLLRRQQKSLHKNAGPMLLPRKMIYTQQMQNWTCVVQFLCLFAALFALGYGLLDWNFHMPTLSSHTVNAVGLCFDIAGALLLWRYGLPIILSPDGGEFLWAEPKPEDAKRARRYRRLSHIAIGFLAVGFALQFVSDFVPT